jgi:signal transduction histidine kinase
VAGLLLPSDSLRLLPLLVIFAAAAAGMVLVADAVRVWLGLAPRQRAPWKEMTETQPGQGGIAWRAAAGVALVGWAAFLAYSLVARLFAAYSWLELIALLLIAGGVALVLGMPVAIGAFLRVSRDKVGTAHDRERQRFAAHLHDSVLQTLALVQRQAHDPVAVARMARRQEHALRAWMAGEAELVSDTVVAALRDAVAAVEDEHGITVEFTAIGDRALDSTCEELVAAGREALRNAARHAGGAPVFVFCQVAPDGRVELFVRDEGPGFDPATVPSERRGIRDAIVGRMAFAGGQAKIESVSGEGTEVTLRVPARKGTR